MPVAYMKIPLAFGKEYVKYFAAQARLLFLNLKERN